MVVYRESERALVTVAGREVTVPVVTYIVHDTVAGSFDSIGAFKVGANRLYAITNNTQHRITKGIAGRLGNHTVFSKVASSNDSPSTIAASYFAKGRETTLDLGNGAAATFPRSLKAVTRALEFSTGQLATYESSSTVIFQFTETKRANVAGDSALVVIERIRQRLEAEGYAPAPGAP